jgi:hypothetical protein
MINPNLIMKCAHIDLNVDPFKINTPLMGKFCNRNFCGYIISPSFYYYYVRKDHDTYKLIHFPLFGPCDL